MGSDIRIVVLQRGWIVVGCYEERGDEIVLTNASVVRRWGTTRGLGEIAIGGPTKLTVLDPVGEARAHKLAVVLTIACATQCWGGVL